MSTACAKTWKFLYFVATESVTLCILFLKFKLLIRLFLMLPEPSWRLTMEFCSGLPFLSVVPASPRRHCQFIYTHKSLLIKLFCVQDFQSYVVFIRIFKFVLASSSETCCSQSRLSKYCISVCCSQKGRNYGHCSASGCFWSLPLASPVCDVIIYLERINYAVTLPSDPELSRTFNFQRETVGY